MRQIDISKWNRTNVTDWRDVEFGISEEEILVRVREMVADTDFMENDAPHADDWNQTFPDLSSSYLFFDLNEYCNSTITGWTWILQAKWDQQRRERPDELPFLYRDDYAGWSTTLFQASFGDSDQIVHDMTQREIGDSDPTEFIDYLNTSKMIASVSAENLRESDTAFNWFRFTLSPIQQDIANMQALISLVDSRLEGLDRGMMFPDDLGGRIQTVGRPGIFGRRERLTQIAMIVILGIIVVTVLLLDYYA